MSGLTTGYIDNILYDYNTTLIIGDKIMFTYYQNVTFAIQLVSSSGSYKLETTGTGIVNATVTILNSTQLFTVGSNLLFTNCYIKSYTNAVLTATALGLSNSNISLFLTIEVPKNS